MSIEQNERENRGFFGAIFSGILKLVSSTVHLAIASSLIGGFIEYQFYQNDQRVLQTLNLLERFQLGAIGGAQRKITSTLRQAEPAIKDLQDANLAPVAAEASRAQLIEFVIYDSNNGEGVWRELDTMFLFVDQVGICVQKKVCDASLADELFLDYSQTLFDNFGDYISEKRTYAPSYALKAEAFVKR